MIVIERCDVELCADCEAGRSMHPFIECQHIGPDDAGAVVKFVRDDIHAGAVALLEEVRRRGGRRPFGGHAPYDLAARIERFLDEGVYEPHPGADGGR